MKPLQEMTNAERAYTLARLFPDELKAITEFIKKEIEHFRSQEAEIRNAWPKLCIATADYWFGLIANTEMSGFIRRYYNKTSRLRGFVNIIVKDYSI